MFNFPVFFPISFVFTTICAVAVLLAPARTAQDLPLSVRTSQEKNGLESKHQEASRRACAAALAVLAGMCLFLCFFSFLFCIYYVRSTFIVYEHAAL